VPVSTIAWQAAAYGAITELGAGSARARKVK
jgi:hypothetical protein